MFLLDNKYRDILRAPEHVLRIKDKERRSEVFEKWKEEKAQELVKDPSSEFYFLRPDNIQEAMTEGLFFEQGNPSELVKILECDLCISGFGTRLKSMIYNYWIKRVDGLIESSK